MLATLVDGNLEPPLLMRLPSKFLPLFELPRLVRGLGGAVEAEEAEPPLTDARGAREAAGRDEILAVGGRRPERNAVA